LEIKDKYGAEAAVFAHGSPRDYGYLVDRLANAFGSPT